MSANQTLIFTALPNGLSAQGNPKLSFYLTPRLEGGASQQLSDYPDFLNWPQFLQKGLTFEIACGSQTTSVDADVSGLRPDIWKAIFTPQTYVQSYQYPDFSGRLVVSYPVHDFHEYIKLIYQTFPNDAFRTFENDRDVGNVGKLDIPYLGFVGLFPMVFRQASQSTLGTTLSNLRVSLWQNQTNPSAAQPLLPTTNGGRIEMSSQFALFHNLPPAPNRPPLPSPPSGFADTLDFHAALTALSSYPALLRALGLVFDLELPASFCPASPAAPGYETISAGSVSAASAWQITPQLCFPNTAYWLDSTTFCAAPASPLTNQTGGIYAALSAAQADNAYSAGDVFGGFLGLPSEDFHLHQVDVDGSGLKLLGLADNVANSLVLQGTPITLNNNDLPTPNVQPVEQTLPSLRTAGIMLIADGRAQQLLASMQNNTKFNNALTSGSTTPPTFSAPDLVRGYRIDIWSSRTRKWQSLHSRSAVYEFGAKNQISLKLSEEGFIQLAAAQPAPDPTRPTDTIAAQAGAPQPGTDIYLHERVARWDGWSLSVARPGQPLNRSADPGKALDEDPTLGQPVTPFKMTTAFTVTKGSLPELRFGATYRLRVRTVDLAGNSLPLNAKFPALPNPFALPATPTGAKYFRFEPVGPAVVVLVNNPEPGASLLQLVIRSNNSKPSLDTIPTTDQDQRHIAPPKTSVRMAEQHGMFDDAKGHLNGSLATYDSIIARDSFKLPAQGNTPISSSPNLKVGYFPDPYAAGAAFNGLPNTPAGNYGRIGSKGLQYTAQGDVDAENYSVTYIDFGTQPWPNAAAFRIMLVEGTAAPQWDAKSRVLTVSLSKGQVVQVPLSCYLNAADLENMGVWDWLRQFYESQQAAAIVSGEELLPNLTESEVTVGTRQALEGGNEMITPALTLTLVHAVQQPLGQPAFLQLPVVHQPSAPIYASALRNLFSPVTAWRVLASHDAVLLGGLQINGLSSSKIELNARWLEVTDDPSLPGPTQSTESQSVEKFDLSSLTDGTGIPPAWPIYAGASQTGPGSMVAVYIQATDVLWFSAPFDHLEGVPIPSDVAAPVHHFQDTKHRWIEYTAVATSRFQEYFANQNADFTRSSEMLVVDVPSSARPGPPDIAYVVPTFGWDTQNTGNVKTSIRRGGGLRVYLNRGWFSSGPDELLGVVLWPGNVPPDVQNSINSSGTASVWDTYKGLFTQWGNDPIWASEDQLDETPAVNDFYNAKASASSLTVPKVTGDMVFDVVGYEVAYDSARQLWYCDIELNNAAVYAPFVRLALVRYQPHSIAGVELSPVQLADFVQIAPDRSAMLSIDPNDPRQAKLFIGGLAPTSPLLTSLQVTIEMCIPNIASDLAWQPASATDVTVTPDALAAVPGEALWSGSIVFTKAPAPNQYRVVIQEVENIATDQEPEPTANSIPTSTPPRIVYAAIIPYNYP